MGSLISFSESFIVCSSRRNKLQTPPLPRLRPTVASLPNCSGPRRFAPQSLPPRDCLAIALRGGERLPLEKKSWVNCYVVAFFKNPATLH